LSHQANEGAYLREKEGMDMQVLNFTSVLVNDQAAHDARAATLYVNTLWTATMKVVGKH
jgi:hypothetical protein